MAQQNSTDYVSTDGCCLSNGQHGAQGGYGLYYGAGNPRNVSEKLEDSNPTSNRAELEGTSRAVEGAKQAGFANVEISTDSDYVIKGATEWIHGWKENGWKTSTGEDVKNRDAFERLDAVSQGINVKFVKVEGHVDPGNVAADKLAKAGAKK